MTPFMLNKSQKNTAYFLWIQMYVCKFIENISRGINTNLITTGVTWGRDWVRGVRGQRECETTKDMREWQAKERRSWTDIHVLKLWKKMRPFNF